MLFARAAQCSAVMPSASDALTLARCFNRARTACVSPDFTASMRFTGAAAETTTDVKTTSTKAYFMAILVSDFNRSRADSELVDIAIELVGQRHHQVCNRGFFRSLN